MALLSLDDPRHGTVNGYNNHGCRCLACRDAAREYHQLRQGRMSREEYVAKMRRQAKDSGRHGSHTMYHTHSCRCDLCREGERRRRAQARQKAYSRPTPERVHGTTNGYQNYGCRCAECREAANNYRAERSGIPVGAFCPHCNRPFASPAYVKGHQSKTGCGGGDDS